MSIEVGSVVEGVVTGITNFGAFVELPEGKSGLVHISEVADEYVKDVHDYLSEHDKVKVRVMCIDERGKIALSIKRAQERPEGARTNPSAGSLPPRPHRVRTDFRRQGRNAAFEGKLKDFMKESDARLADFRRRTDSKRGGRGSRRG